MHRHFLCCLATFVPVLFPWALSSTASADAGAGTTNCTVSAAHLTPDAEEQAVLDLTNAYRVTNGLAPLRLSQTLSLVSRWKSTDMAAQHYFSHDDLFRSWSQRFTDCGYIAGAAGGAFYEGENLAAGNATGAATEDQWRHSPEHNANLLDPNFTAVGIARVQSGDRYGWYWTMDLGSAQDTDLITASGGQ